MPPVLILFDDVVSLLQPTTSNPKSPTTTKEARTYIFLPLGKSLLVKSLDGAGRPDNQRHFPRGLYRLRQFGLSRSRTRACARARARLLSISRSMSTRCWRGFVVVAAVTSCWSPARKQTPSAL